MGCVLGVCATQAACCCASASCHLCCSCCPSSVTSVMTRLMYLFFIILGILLSSVFLMHDVKEALSKSPDIPFIDTKSYCSYVTGGENCASVIGYKSVYRVWFAFSMFFLFMAIMTIGVRSSDDCRAKWQNGFWFFKFLIIAGAMVGAFFIPEAPFTEVWLYIGLIGGVLFIFVQVVYLIDVAHSWTESWLENVDENPCYKVGFLLSTLILYGLSLAGIIGMFVQFTTSDACNMNKALISINMILCIVVSVMSVLPGVQEANPRSGILQASLVTLYVTYLTFSALSAEPKAGNDSSNAYCTKNMTDIAGGEISMLVVGIVLAVLTIFVVSLKSSGDAGSGGSLADDAEAPVQKVSDDEEDGTQYSYWMFHVLCFLGTLYLMMVMTNWLEPESVSNGFKFEPSWATFWVQIVAAWLCLALYVWTLIAPIACPNRSFSWASNDE